MRNHVTLLAAMLAAAAGCAVPSAQAAAVHSSLNVALPPTGAACVFKKSEYLTATSAESTTSTNWVNVSDGGAITFTQSRTGCVAGTFSAIGGNESSGDSIRLQILLDGVACDPFVSNLSFAQSGVDLSQHSISFLCGGNVAPGSHKIQVQYHSGAGGKADFFQRTLEVKHH
ncbi:MAG: hypothetical protein ACJ8EL_14825 [Rhizomicrobium sp.]